MRLSTPPFLMRGQFAYSVDTSRPKRSFVHADVHALTTPRCGHRFSQFSAASTTLSTLSTPYNDKKEVGYKTGVNGGSESRDRFSTKGVDSLSVDTRL